MSKKFSGLSPEEVTTRINLKQTNTTDYTFTKSIKSILFENTVTLFNIINIILAILIFTTGSYKNLLFIGVIFINTIIGIYQELRSKKTIDNLALVHQNKISVIRSNQVKHIKQNEIVLDDLILVNAGDQFVVDGVIIDTTKIECDESALTGESTLISKNINDNVFSGSYLVSGKAIIKTTKVGADCFISQLTLEAKQTKEHQSKLIQSLKRIIKWVSFIIIPFGLILFATSLLNTSNYSQAILSSTAAIIGMIPEGLILITSIALALGSYRLAKNNVLVKSIASIETLARVDALCLDKTGTLTTNKLIVENIIDFKSSQNILSQVIYDIDDQNATAQAIKNYFNPSIKTKKIIEITPFSSQRKYSAIIYDDISYYLGAFDYLVSKPTLKQQNIINDAIKNGSRVLAFSSSQQRSKESLPNDLELLSLIIISDEIRPSAKATLSYFNEQDVLIKIISGDYYQTVENIAKKIGLEYIKGIDMSKVDDSVQYSTLVNEYNIFGRVSPQQKKELVLALQENGHTVGMTGDGINDILALKQADCSIVMNNASDATKGIADFVLLDSNFDSMINVLLEGRRVINNIQRVASLYLTKTVYSIFLTFFFIFLNFAYPFQPIQLTPINALSVGIPSFFLALRPSFSLVKGNFLKNAFTPSLASGTTITIYILLIHILANPMNLSYLETSTLSVLLTGYVSFIVLHYIAQPLNTLTKLLIITLFTIFIIVFTLFNNLFSVTSIFQVHLAIIYLPMLVSAPFLFYFIKKIVTKYLRT